MDQRANAYELLVVSQRDSGLRFSLEAPRVPIGRDLVPGAELRCVRLSDPTVSARQAVIHLTAAGPVIEHLPGATNPTLVNGRPVARQRLAAGDRIQVGAVALELRSRPTDARAARGEQPSGDRAIPGRGVAEASTEQRATVARDPHAPIGEGRAWGRLLLTHGVPGFERREFRLSGERISIGRSAECDIGIPEAGVSKLHAQLAWRNGRLFVEHCSRTNATYVNGLSVPERVALEGDAEIQLADAVGLRLEFLDQPSAIEAPSDETGRTELRRSSPLPPPRPREASTSESQGLLTSLNAQIEQEHVLRDQLVRCEDGREAEIDRRFGFTGTFLDIDVVDSYGMKERASRSDYIIVSFERFRKFVAGIVEEFDGEILNSNGDELMCFFESPLQAVRTASTLVTRLEAFNQTQNLLESPFRVRQGAHTGHSLVDRKRGVAYSPILDVAGHLQKDAEVDGLLISQHTLDALPDDQPFERSGELKREGIPTHRLTGRLS